MNEWVLAVREEDQGEIVLGCQDGGSVVEDAVGVPGLLARPRKIVFYFLIFVVSCSKKFWSAQGLIPF